MTSEEPEPFTELVFDKNHLQLGRGHEPQLQQMMNHRAFGYVAIVVFACRAPADAQKPWNQKPRAEKIEDDYVRAGHPWEIRPWAQPTRTPAYDFGYVGGGAAFRWGEPRTLEEGVWGRDYVGALYPRRVWLNWWHGARYQGGTRGYAIDGPKLREAK